MPAKSFTLNILIKETDDLFVAHCLELDIVATADNLTQARNDIMSLVCTQIECAFSNDNFDNLFHSAPAEVWHEFLSCKKKIEEEKRRLEIVDTCDSGNGKIPPPWLIAKICQTTSDCYA